MKTFASALLIGTAICQPTFANPVAGPACVMAERVLDGPIIHPGLDPSITENIQGPR